jgi:hypothetical protein
VGYIYIHTHTHTHFEPTHYKGGKDLDSFEHYLIIKDVKSRE